MASESVRALLASATGASGETAEAVYAKWSGVSLAGGRSLEQLVRLKVYANGIGTGTVAAPQFPAKVAASKRESLLAIVLAGGAGGTGNLSSALAAGTPVTSLPVAALTEAVPSGVPVQTAGGRATSSAAAAVGATAIPVSSFTPRAPVPSGSRITWGAESVEQVLRLTGLVGWS